MQSETLGATKDSNRFKYMDASAAETFARRRNTLGQVSGTAKQKIRRAF
jgi:hypothetical protein